MCIWELRRQRGRGGGAGGEEEEGVGGGLICLFRGAEMPGHIAHCMQAAYMHVALIHDSPILDSSG
jgi:hypothetical protein